MKRVLLATTLALCAAVSVGAQSKGLVADVRAAIAQKDFAQGDRLLAESRAAKGVTSEWLLALSWMGRGALAVKQLDQAEKYAEQTYSLAKPLVAKSGVDADKDLPIAVGAAIEVLGQSYAARGARSDAIAYLQGELAKFKSTSLNKRIQKNINLLTLEGQAAPAIDLSEYLGTRPPALDAYKGKVVVLFFWAHWCPDCKKQAPILANIVQRYGGKGVVLYAPTQRFGYVAGGKPASPDEEKRYIEDIRKQFFPVLEGSAVPLSEANHLRYGVSSTPTLVIVDRAGVVRRYHPGTMSEEELDRDLRALLD